MRVRISEERRGRLVEALQGFFREKFDEELSEFKAGLLLEFVVEELGPPVYNQAVRDAHDFLQEKLVDLQGEFYEAESRDGGGD